MFKTFRKSASTRLLTICWKAKRRSKLSRKYGDALSHSIQPDDTASFAFWNCQSAVTHSLQTRSGPPADHWALVSGLPSYVAENGFVSSTFVAFIFRATQQ